MTRLILKCPYLKGGTEKAAAHLDNLVKYIATRNGVEKVSDERRLWHSTKKQKDLIAHILKELPDSKNSLEYEDYCDNPNRENASEFITIALEQHLDKMGDRQKYLDYIANRPRVEKFNTHGLFTGSNEQLVLSQVARAVSEHTGNVWTPIISLRREDAALFSFDNATSWKAMLSSKAVEIAKSLKIHPDHFKWYGAFHNESHHPHVHMICYSTNSSEGYLTREGIRKMKSVLTNEIFKAELIPLYAEKTFQRDELKKKSAAALQEMILKMQGSILQNEKIEQLILHLADRLQHTTGKKQYGYLHANLKNIVDEIVNELARDEHIAAAYLAWQETKGLIDSVYSEQTVEAVPLSKCADFKSIKNMVIKEAMRIADGSMSFEEPSSAENDLQEPENEDALPYVQELSGSEETNPDDEPVSNHNSNAPIDRGRSSHPSWWTEDYKLAKQYLHGNEDADIVQDFEVAQELFLTEADKNNPLAMCDLGRVFADGLGCEASKEKSYEWYAKGLAVFHTTEETKPWKYTQYRIGKMYTAGLGTEQDCEQAAHWLTLSAEQKYKYAEYSLGGLYYHGKGVEQNYETAFNLYLRSAKQKFPYASFEVGKMLRNGIGCAKDSKESQIHFADAFHGFEELEKKSHDDKLQYRLGWMLLNGVGTEKDFAAAIVYFEKAATVGNPFACYQLAKMILGKENPASNEVEKALSYLLQAVETENPYAEYYLAKLYEKGQHVSQNIEEAIRLYKLSAEQNHDYAAYRLGKIYLIGEDVPKDVETALRYLSAAANQENQYAQYTLGKLFLMGKDVPKDKEIAAAWFARSAEQGNIYAQFFLDHMDDWKEPSAMMAATRLLHHLSQIFADNTPSISTPHQQMESKLMRKIKEKKQAQGHARDDHEQIMSY